MATSSKTSNLLDSWRNGTRAEREAHSARVDYAARAADERRRADTGAGNAGTAGQWDPRRPTETMRYLTPAQQATVRARMADTARAISDVGLLTPEMQRRTRMLVERMQSLGWDPRVFETWRCDERQTRVRGAGASRVRRSRHQDGEAADIISARYLWGGSNLPKKERETAQRFFAALEVVRDTCGLQPTGHNFEQCHVEMSTRQPDTNWNPKDYEKEYAGPGYRAKGAGRGEARRGTE